MQAITRNDYSQLQSIKYFHSCTIGLNMSHDQKFPNFKNCACCEKDMRDNTQNNLHLGQNYPWTLSVPLSSQFFSSYGLAKLFTSQNRCHRQISQHLSKPNGGYCLCICALNGGYCLLFFKSFFQHAQF